MATKQALQQLLQPTSKEGVGRRPKAPRRRLAIYDCVEGRMYSSVADRLKVTRLSANQ